MAVHTHSSPLGASQLTQWYLASHPFNLPQPTQHLCCHCHEASTKKRDFVPVLPPYCLW